MAKYNLIEMSLWKAFKRINSTDYTPRYTKFVTKYIMPLMVIACGYGFWFVSELLNASLSDFTNIKTFVGEIELQNRSNNKPIETIYTDLYLTTSDGLRLHKTDIGKYSVEIISNRLTTADEVEIFYDDQTGKIKEFRKDNESIISFQSELESHRRGRITIAVFFFVFLFWYISRLYRYRKYGKI